MSVGLLSFSRKAGVAYKATTLSPPVPPSLARPPTPPPIEDRITYTRYANTLWLAADWHAVVRHLDERALIEAIEGVAKVYLAARTATMEERRRRAVSPVTTKADRM